MTQSSMMVYHVNTHGTLCTTFDISATCQAMVFGDAGGNLRVEIVAYMEFITFGTIRCS